MTMNSWERHVRNSRAQRKVKKALKEGMLVRPDTCELCGRKPLTIEVHDYRHGTHLRSPIYAHHWNGHENALDVWWICHDCNARLLGDEFHNGTITKEEAKAIVRQPRKHNGKLVPKGLTSAQVKVIYEIATLVGIGKTFDARKVYPKSDRRDTMHRLSIRALIKKGLLEEAPNGLQLPKATIESLTSQGFRFSPAGYVTKRHGS